ncbi:hypothetical protein SAMN05421812_101105 [Asanoa hainanensis]|uniref:Uncharacterized protein n=1 Tax=Asanoa hainanensis TaxID=560556 RepID=A0A239FXX7_9ACTN|nr:hypothetical protein [Asanoa hainanensis]SNS61102.1 hypothetical protein SAMN05421812_101105 [Asanoa hainanensis]
MAAEAEALDALSYGCTPAPAAEPTPAPTPEHEPQPTPSTAKAEADRIAERNARDLVDLVTRIDRDGGDHEFQGHLRRSLRRELIARGYLVLTNATLTRIRRPA